MNPSIKQSSDLASKPTKTIIGLMSGTSLDGLDIALCEIRGSGADTEVKLRKFISKPYDTEIKNRLNAITSVDQASLEEVCMLHSWLGDYHGELVLEALEEWNIKPSKIDCIASHGQTIYHAPKSQHQQQKMPNTTLQIGDGDHIAHKTDILTISDFRQKHTAAGGEGAPMAAFVDRMLFTDPDKDRILLNIGGIANFTYLPAESPPNQPSITTDTGPGNTLIDAAMRKYFDRDFDEDGTAAQQGVVQPDVLSALKSDPYFQQSLPKTTGPETFHLNWVSDQLRQANLDLPSPKDLIATLTQLSAETIADTILNITEDEQSPNIYVSGGGLHNPVLMNALSDLLPGYTIDSFESLGCNPDAKEAVIFALLANEMLSGDGFKMGLESGKRVNFGKISFPD